MPRMSSKALNAQRASIQARFHRIDCFCYDPQLDFKRTFMSLKNKQISPQAIIALKEALAVIFWKKGDLQDFLKITIENSAIVSTVNWGEDVTKRSSVKELVERMLARQDIYKEDLVKLIIAVSEFGEFPHLKFWDEDGSKTKTAKEAVLRLRNLSEGYIQLVRELEVSQTRREDTERQIAKNKSLTEEMSKLKAKFQEIADNKNLQRRGYQLETFLKELFQLYELDPKGSFKINGEQIDGAFTFQGTDYLLEAKWKFQVDRGEIAAFCYKVETKFKNAVGLLVTMEGVTPEAISEHFKSIIIMDGVDIAAIVDGYVSLPDLLYKKRRRAVESGNIYVNYLKL